MFLNKFRFSHEIAQAYELRSQRDWIERNFERVYYGRTKDSAYQWLREWFPDVYSFDSFLRSTAGKTCLEIGSGPSGNIIYFWWAARRIIIDPLVTQYQQIQLTRFGKSWFDRMDLIPCNAEVLNADLIGAVNGAIICRNTLDHCADPMLVLENIAKYAAPGCYLLLWTDLYHPGGHDEGHQDITRDPAAFTRKLTDLGFVIEYVTQKKPGRKTIHYGCRARKAWK
jgi:SAM-dependent methyltransferase